MTAASCCHGSLLFPHSSCVQCAVWPAYSYNRLREAVQMENVHIHRIGPHVVYSILQLSMQDRGKPCWSSCSPAWLSAVDQCLYGPVQTRTEAYRGRFSYTAPLPAPQPVNPATWCPLHTATNQRSPVTPSGQSLQLQQHWG